MIRWIFAFLIGLVGSVSFARVSSYFTLTGDRVMINIQSGHAFNPSHDDDAIRLFNAMNVNEESSIMGKGKKIDWKSLLTMIVANRGQGQYHGTIMVYQSPGVHIDSSRKSIEVHWNGEEATYIFERLKHEDGSFEYSSVDGRLKIYSSQNQFVLSYKEYESSFH